MWIATRDETPPLRQPVLLFTSFAETVIGQLEDRVPWTSPKLTFILATDSPEEGYTLVGIVTHWMPLPAKPGEEGPSWDDSPGDAVAVLKRLLPLVESYWDEGPRGEGWQSGALSSALAAGAEVVRIAREARG